MERQFVALGKSLVGYWSLIFLLAFLPKVAVGQSFYSISFDAGPKYTEQFGAGFSGQFNVGFSNIYVSINPLNINFVERDQYKQYNVGAWRFCVDQQQVDVADPSNCSGRFKKVFGYTADLNYLLAAPKYALALGVGYRFGVAPTPYHNSTVILQDTPRDSGHYWYGRLRGGYQMVSVGFGIAFNL